MICNTKYMKKYLKCEKSYSNNALAISLQIGNKQNQKKYKLEIPDFIFTYGKEV